MPSIPSSTNAARRLAISGVRTLLVLLPLLTVVVQAVDAGPAAGSPAPVGAIPPGASNGNPTTPAAAQPTPDTGYLGHTQMQSLVSSVLVTIVSEIGDKTFFIAAIMAMKHSRLLIFSAALSALAVMTVLSALMGHVLPHLIPQRFVELAAALLFLVFGVKMIMEGWEMEADHALKEMDETSAELEDAKKGEEAFELEAGEFAIGGASGSHQPATGSSTSAAPRHNIQIRGGSPATNSQDADSAKYHSGRTAGKAMSTGEERLPGLVGHLHYLMQQVFSPVFLQTALIMFVAEWGDRSQLATIALAAAADMVWVSIGTIFGHALCTGLAVVGGRILATRISVRTVTLSGGALFIVFGLVYTYEGLVAATVATTATN
ncbi:GCR1-dependent translation factor 1 [Tieghemiomyces parasiticus]|uniref:GDT1 family protein n=1 Tax=Tieghemiomyces parasiticus TaxID=78921 RepID=A0A9W8DRQ5_9FUNG|nr:GCR1-dependent translation factor 1 [Tieghemiomyces parasiticus]